MTAVLPAGPSTSVDGPVPSPVHPARIYEQRPLEPRSPVTSRQAQILRLAANGNTNAAIARHLGISEETVKSQLRAVYPKLRVKDRTQAVAVALLVGVLSLEDVLMPAGLRTRPGWQVDDSA